MTDWYNEKNKTSFRDVVISHIKKVLEITTIEFRGGYVSEKIKDGMVERTYVPNTRKIYIQAIQSLSDVLLPYFDKDMKGVYPKIIEDYDSIQNDKDISGKDKIKKQVLVMRKLFQELNMLLNRKDYLKTADYSESDLDDDELEALRSE